MIQRKIIITALTLLLVSASLLLVSACSSSGGGYSRTSVHYGAGYRGYHGRPWGYRPVYIDGGIDPDWGVDPGMPVATPLPEMGMPDMGGMDFGGFDW